MAWHLEAPDMNQELQASAHTIASAQQSLSQGPAAHAVPIELALRSALTGSMKHALLKDSTLQLTRGIAAMSYADLPSKDRERR